MSHFLEFWGRYPKKVNKIGCEEKWKKKKLDEQWDRIKAFLDWAPRFDDKWKSGFIPNPETFINQERWNDHDKHMQPRGISAQGALASGGPDLNKVVAWVIQNKKLTPEQITAPWKWVSNGSQITGVLIPNLPPLRFASMRGAGVENG